MNNKEILSKLSAIGEYIECGIIMSTDKNGKKDLNAALAILNEVKNELFIRDIDVNKTSDPTIATLIKNGSYPIKHYMWFGGEIGFIIGYEDQDKKANTIEYQP